MKSVGCSPLSECCASKFMPRDNGRSPESIIEKVVSVLFVETNFLDAKADFLDSMHTQVSQNVSERFQVAPKKGPVAREQTRARGNCSDCAGFPRTLIRAAMPRWGLTGRRIERDRLRRPVPSGQKNQRRQGDSRSRFEVSLLRTYLSSRIVPRWDPECNW